MDDIIAAREQANDKLREELVRYDKTNYLRGGGGGRQNQMTIILLNLSSPIKRQKNR